MPELEYTWSVNGVYFGSSILLYNLGNDLSSKKPKYVLKSSFTVFECVLRHYQNTRKR